MAVQTIEEHRVRQFSDQLHIIAQQSKSRLRPFVDIIKMTGKDYAYDSLGETEAEEVTGSKGQAVKFGNIDHLRRQLKKREFTVTLPVYENDVEEVLSDPTGRYQEAIMKAMNRVMDRIVYESAFADVATGENFDTTVTAAADGVRTVDATAGLTYEKFLEMHQNWIDDEVTTEDTSDRCLLTITGDEHTALMSESELINSDFTRQTVVDRGRITSAVGIDLIKFGANAKNPILQTVGGNRELLLLKRGGIVVGSPQAMTIKVQDRPDLYRTKQIQAVLVMGAVRTEGKLLQKVTVTP